MLKSYNMYVFNCMCIYNIMCIDVMYDHVSSIIYIYIYTVYIMCIYIYILATPGLCRGAACGCSYQLKIAQNNGEKHWL